jgi:uncharacterized protein (DUF362 family)
VTQVPTDPFTTGNRHEGVDTLIKLMGQEGLKFYRSSLAGDENGANGLIASDDVVLIKVSAYFKYRGCTNSDLIRGLIQRVLDHPDGFTGEVVIIENSQGMNNLNCDQSSSYDNGDVHANAQNESHSYLWLVNSLFNDPRVSAFQLDPIRGVYIGADEHTTNGYRTYENVSYPCFTTAGGRRVELREGVWTGSSHATNLKLINVPVLKDHSGAYITAAIKNMYGVLSMLDDYYSFRHYSGLGESCGKMLVSVRTPVLNIMDAIWVSFGDRKGYPADQTFRADKIVASQDPVALDYWCAKHILYPIDSDPRHNPDNAFVDGWITSTRDTIIDRGGFDGADQGILVETPTKTESEMAVHEAVSGSI